MATKTITGAYPGGYYLKPAYTTLDIAATAVIGGTGIQASSSQASTIDNAGTIAPTGAGIVLLDGGAVTNENSGRIAGGVAISGQSGAVTNAGVVTGNSYTLSSSGTITRHQQASVVLAQGGTVTNAAGGDLAGGVSIRGVAGAVANYGTIGGPQTSTVTGGGTVTTTYASVALLHGGSVVNGSATDASATLTQGISLVGAGTITNFGVIGSTSAGVSAYLSGAGDVFIEEGSGVIDGSILCVATSFPTGLLELAADDGAGTISGLGSSITGFANVEVKSGGTWTLAGANTIVAGETLTNAADLVDDGTLTNGGAVVLQAAMRLATNAEIDNVAGAFMTLVAGAGVLAAGGATGLTLVNAGVVASPGGSSPAEIAADVVNTGSVLTDGGVLNIDGAVSGAGAWRIGADATLDLHNAVAAGATIAFAGEDGLATIGDAAGFAGTIAHFASTDSLDVTGATIDLSTVALNAKTKLSWSDEGTYGVLTVTDGTRTAHVAFAGRYDTASFTLKSDGGSGLDLGFVATTTTLTGKYSGDYDLASAFDAVTVTASGTIVGELSTSARGPVSITNLGNIGTVALADGSALLNESQCGGVSGTGDVTNYGSIKASGDNAGVSIQGNLQNFGVITGGAYSHTSGNYTYEQKSLYGVIVSFGTVENGSLSDENVTIVGVELYRSTLHNYGTLVGTAINGVGYYGDLYQSTSYSAVLYGGTIFNGSSSDKTATIASGLEFGRSSSGTMFNYGTIDARFASENGISDSLYAVYFRGTGTVVNGGPTDKIATIAGIYNRFGFATVINFGTITPGGFQQRAVHLSDQSRLIEEASGVLQGTVVGSNSDQGVLELGAAAGNGAIAGIGDTITNFGTIDVDPGAEWAFSDDNLSKVKTLSCAGTIALASGEVVSVPSVTLAGAGAIVRATGATGTSVVNIGTLVRAGGAGASRIATSVDNAGTVLDAGGGLNIFGAVTGSGAWDIGAGAELSFRDGVAAGGTVAFAGANGTLQLADAAGFAGAVAGFGGGGETVDLSSIAFGSGVTLGWSGGPSGGALTVTSGTEVARIAFLGHYAPASFTASSDGGSGTDISFVAATKTISSGYPNGYTLAAGHYLTITSIGSIGGPGLLAETHATVTNSGRIAAAAGADSYSQASAGGVAATLVGSNVLANDKLIAGGRGGAGLFENVQPVGPTYGGSGAGGAGLKASSGTVVNYSTIRGGAGGYGHDGGGTGGGGVYLSSGVLTNRRWILGGAGGVSASVGGAGGVGAWISKATATNTGTIAGGAGGNGAAQHYGHGGVGVTLAASVLINGGSILGGAGGGSSPGLTQGNGVDVRGAASIINQAGGLIRGYIAIDNPGYGAVTVTNYGTISGYTCGVNFLQTAHSASDRLIEEGTGVLSGEVFGGGGTLELAAGAGTGTIGGLGGSILGFGHIAVDAGAGWHLTGANSIASGVTLSNAAAIIIDGTFGNQGVIDNSALIRLSAKAELDNHGQIFLVGDVGISPDTGASGTTFVNDGLLEKKSGTGTSSVREAITDFGHIAVKSGTLDLAGIGNTIAGVISGAGTIDFRLGSTTLEAGAAVTTAFAEITGSGARLILATSLTYAHAFSAATGTVLTIDSAKTLTLTGAANFVGDTIAGAGHLTTKGATTLSAVTLSATGEWLNAGTVGAAGKLTVGDAGGDKSIFFNEATGVFDITGTGGIGVGANTASRFDNAGLLERTGPTGTGIIAVKVLNTGTIEAASGVLDFTGAVSGGGALDIGAGATLAFASTVAGAGHAAFTGAKGVLQLGDAAAFKASVSGFAAGQTIDARGGGFGAATTLAYSGTSSSGVLTLTDGASIARIALIGQYAAANFKAASDGHGGVDITFVAAPAAPALATPG